MIRMTWIELPASDGGADLALVRAGPDGKPSCVRHGAMNKVSAAGFWRCITTTGSSGRGCDAGCFETNRTVVPEPVCVCTVGVQECPLHPGRLRTKQEKIAFRKAWDRRVEEAAR